ncbi:MAG: glutamine amidotransferase [Candidatus Omnitrophica bacterium CG11_big_fil_rev_8_21_14_0_20_64_10]|nr:MAG: glutamine amidotransferase [Candidatus Omnitrophica bacterium CG11_big_fil_rev_8_21_14_0_20_64_10]
MTPPLRSPVWIFQHAAPETPGLIEEVLASGGVPFELFRSFEGAAVPARLDAAVGLVIMGGPMGVGDRMRYPYLRGELKLIEQALRTDRPILGVCLGAQMLASVLGAPVYPGKRKEIGWEEITLIPEGKGDPLFRGMRSPAQVFHWHGETFDLPAGAVRLAASAVTPNQAFRHGRTAYGLQFHLEVTETMVGGMVKAFAGELAAERLDGAAILRESARRLPALQRVAEPVFREWVQQLEVPV